MKSAFGIGVVIPAGASSNKPSSVGYCHQNRVAVGTGQQVILSGTNAAIDCAGLDRAGAHTVDDRRAGFDTVTPQQLALGVDEQAVAKPAVIIGHPPLCGGVACTDAPIGRGTPGCSFCA